jgi:hypothetical protein
LEHDGRLRPSDGSLSTPPPTTRTGRCGGAQR